MRGDGSFHPPNHMLKFKFKQFKTPTQEPVRVLNPDGSQIAWIYPEWTELREDLWKDAYSQGCISKDMSRVGMGVQEAIAHQVAVEEAFLEQVEKAMRSILEEGDPNKIDSYGKPKVSAIGEIVGETPNATVRNRIYEKIQKKK